MTDKHRKVPLSGQIRLPEELDKAIDIEGARVGLFKYEVIAQAWSHYVEAEKQGNASFDLPVEALRRFRIACSERGRKPSEVIEELILGWTNQERPSSGIERIAELLRDRPQVSRALETLLRELSGPKLVKIQRKAKSR